MTNKNNILKRKKEAKGPVTFEIPERGPKVINEEGIAKPTMLISVEYYTQLIDQIGRLIGKNEAIERELKELKAPIPIEEVEEIRSKQYTTIPEAEYRALIEQKSYAEGRIAELEKQLEKKTEFKTEYTKGTDNIILAKNEIIPELKREKERMNSLKTANLDEGYSKTDLEKIHERINGKIERYRKYGNMDKDAE